MKKPESYIKALSVVKMNTSHFLSDLREIKESKLCIVKKPKSFAKKRDNAEKIIR